MDTPQSPVAPPVASISEEAAFLALANAGRRHLLRRLAAAGAQGLTVSEAIDSGRKQRNLTLKNFEVLASLHIVGTATDSRDGRKTRYTLTPFTTTRRTQTGWELDFGCAVLRWATGAEAAPFPRPLVRNRRR